MGFSIDKQTLDDLNIFGRHDRNSVYTLFCRTVTKGGAALLEEMFRYPLDNAEAINRRTAIIRFFREAGIDFPYQATLFDSVEYYLGNTDSRNRISPENDTLQRKFRSAVGAENEYELLHKGLISMIEIINISKDFINRVEKLPGHDCYNEFISGFKEIFRETDTGWTEKERGKKRLPYARMALYDKILRYDENASMKKLLRFIFHLDVSVSVGKIAAERGFVFAEAFAGKENMTKIDGLYHPLLEKPVGNDIRIGGKDNIVFLTGANMAGKSTLMKSLGIAVFLAHAGFPVPATSMAFNVCNGLYTTINLADNIYKGYSHFYTEVLRVKKVAREVAKEKRYFVIFDELFRGTNVKDAYDATVAISEAFAGRNGSTFVISTHILEAGTTLAETCGNISFLYLPTTMEDGVPVYSYKLREGITDDRHGMVIIRNEGILEILGEKETAEKPIAAGNDDRTVHLPAKIYNMQPQEGK